MHPTFHSHATHEQYKLHHKERRSIFQTMQKRLKDKQLARKQKRKNSEMPSCSDQQQQQGIHSTSHSTTDDGACDAIATVIISEEFTNRPNRSSYTGKAYTSPSSHCCKTVTPSITISKAAPNTSNMPCAECDQKILSRFGCEQQQHGTAAPISQRLALRVKDSLLLVWHGLAFAHWQVAPIPGAGGPAMLATVL